MHGPPTATGSSCELRWQFPLQHVRQDLEALPLVHETLRDHQQRHAGAEPAGQRLARPAHARGTDAERNRVDAGQRVLQFGRVKRLNRAWKWETQGGVLCASLERGDDFRVQLGADQSELVAAIDQRQAQRAAHHAGAQDRDPRHQLLLDAAGWGLSLLARGGARWLLGGRRRERRKARRQAEVRKRRQRRRQRRR